MHLGVRTDESSAQLWNTILVESWALRTVDLARVVSRPNKWAGSATRHWCVALYIIDWLRDLRRAGDEARSRIRQLRNIVADSGSFFRQLL